jgi:hypothetical protein
MNTLVFTIKTKADTKNGRRLYGKANEMARLNAKDVERVMLLQQRLYQADNLTETLPLHLQQIEIITVSICINQDWAVYQFHSKQADEKTLLQQFYYLLDHSMTLVSWQSQWLRAFLRQRHLLYAGQLPTHHAMQVLQQHVDLALQLQLPMQAHLLAELSQLLGFPAALQTDALLAAKMEVWQIHRLWLRQQLNEEAISWLQFDLIDRCLQQQMACVK